ncbi:MAG: DDE-type integrase/transposase/recombinase [Clostridia bacterium]|nr:DDE-type integrase/transposase/recombinase [Clostridia bacterium]
MPPQAQPESWLTQKNVVSGCGLLEYGPFRFQRMRYSKQTVAIALYFSVYIALPATTTATILKDLFSVSPSADTILIWTKKAALCLYRELGQLELPVSGKVHIDETFLFHNRHKVFWASRDPVHRLIPAWSFSEYRDAVSCFNFLNQLSGNGQRLTVVSDGLPTYKTVVPIVLPGARHIVYKGFDHLPNNNVIERQHGWLKAPLRAFWGIKSKAGIVAYALNRILTYNFLIPQKALGDKTPAEHAGLGTYRKGSPWQSLMYYVFKASYGVA